MPDMQPDAIDLLDLVPELPSPSQRWTVARKAMVIRAVRGGWVPIEAPSFRYKLSRPARGFSEVYCPVEL